MKKETLTEGQIILIWRMYFELDLPIDCLNKEAQKQVMDFREEFLETEFGDEGEMRFTSEATRILFGDKGEIVVRDEKIALRQRAERLEQALGDTLLIENVPSLALENVNG